MPPHDAIKPGPATLASWHLTRWLPPGNATFLDYRGVAHEVTSAALLYRRDAASRLCWELFRFRERLVPLYVIPAS